MIRNCFMLLVLSVVVCFVNGWRVFPLPDAPASVPVKPTPVLSRVPIASLKNSYSPNNFVKPTPVLPRFPVVSTTANFPQKYNAFSKSTSPVLSTQDVSVPASDLLPPQTEYVVYEP